MVVGKSQDDVFRKITKRAVQVCDVGDNVRVEIEVPHVGYVLGRFWCTHD
jgi:hypothetical protein